MCRRLRLQPVWWTTTSTIRRSRPSRAEPAPPAGAEHRSTCLPAAVHSDAPTAEATEWSQVVALYDQLIERMPTPVVALNRALAVGELRGPDAALGLLEGLDLDRYHLFHAARADLLARLGRVGEATEAYASALDVVTNEAERELLERRLEELAGPGG